MNQSGDTKLLCVTRILTNYNYVALSNCYRGNIDSKLIEEKS